MEAMLTHQTIEEKWEASGLELSFNPKLDLHLNDKKHSQLPLLYFYHISGEGSGTLETFLL